MQGAQGDSLLESQGAPNGGCPRTPDSGFIIEGIDSGFIIGETAFFSRGKWASKSLIIGSKRRDEVKSSRSF